MTYSQSAQGQEITLGRALFEVRQHGASEYEFLSENKSNDKGMYRASDVLAWLGY